MILLVHFDSLRDSRCWSYKMQWRAYRWVVCLLCGCGCVCLDLCFVQAFVCFDRVPFLVCKLLFDGQRISFRCFIKFFSSSPLLTFVVVFFVLHCCNSCCFITMMMMMMMFFLFLIHTCSHCGPLSFYFFSDFS